MISDNHAISFDINKCFALDGISLCSTKVAIAKCRPRQLLQRSTNQSLGSSPKRESHHLWISRTKIEYGLTYFMCAPNFSFRKWTRHDTKIAGEYCWAMTQAAGRSGCGWSGTSVLDFGCKLDSLLSTHIIDHMCVYSFRTWAKFDFGRPFRK